MTTTARNTSGDGHDPILPTGSGRESKPRVLDERGDVTATVITFGLASIMVFFVIQVALLFHARSVVTAAAQDAVRAAQVENATSADAQNAATQILGGSSGLLNNESVMVSHSGEFVTVTVTAEVTPVVFGMNGPVTASASGVVERFRPQSER